MIEKVNPSHPDKLADRVAGAIVDLAYTKNDNPRVLRSKRKKAAAVTAAAEEEKA